jgi:hypothetical protein
VKTREEKFGASDGATSAEKKISHQLVELPALTVTCCAKLSAPSASPVSHNSTSDVSLNHNRLILSNLEFVKSTH